MQWHDAALIAIIVFQGLLLFSVAIAKGKELGIAHEKKTGSLDIKVNIDAADAEKTVSLLQQRVESLIKRIVEYNKIAGASVDR